MGGEGRRRDAVRVIVDQACGGSCCGCLFAGLVGVARGGGAHEGRHTVGRRGTLIAGTQRDGGRWRDGGPDRAVFLSLRGLGRLTRPRGVRLSACMDRNIQRLQTLV